MKNKKEEPYKIKRSKGKFILCVIFWVALLFVFIRGVVSVVAPRYDSGKYIKAVRSELLQEHKETDEIKAFAENFTKQYVTYTSKEEKPYQERLDPYVSQTLKKQLEEQVYVISSEPVSVTSYRLEPVGKGYEVYVNVIAKETYMTDQVVEELGSVPKIGTSEELEEQEITRNQGYVLKIFVNAKKDTYFIERMPLYVNDSGYYKEGLTDVKIAVSYPEVKDEERIKKITETTESFLTSYYSEKQSVIDYYLDGSADKEALLGMWDSTMTFTEIEDVDIYQKDTMLYVLDLTYRVVDETTKAEIEQQCYLTLREDKGKGKLFIVSMDTTLE